MKYLLLFLVFSAGCRQKPALGRKEARQLYELNKVAAQDTAERRALKAHIDWEENTRLVSLLNRYGTPVTEQYLDSVSGARYEPRWPAWYSEHRRLKDSLLQSGAHPRP